MIQQKITINREKILIILLVLVGIFLRLPSLDLGLWRDESSTYFNSIPNSFEEVINTVKYSELNPPVFYLIMHQWMQWFGDQEITFKIPALVFGLLLIPSTYALGELTGSSKSGLIAATITTFAKDSVYYSQEARPYTLASLLICWVMFLYCKSLTKTKNQIWYLVGFVICLSTLLYVQYTGLLLIVALIVITLYLIFNRTINNVIPFLLAFGVVFLLFMPWLEVFLFHLSTSTPWTVKEPFLGVFNNNIFYPLFNPKRTNLVLVVLGLSITINKLFQPKSDNRATHIPSETYTLILGACFIILIAMQAVLSYEGRYVLPFAPIAWAVYGSCLISLIKFLSDYVNSKVTHKWPHYLSQLILVLTVIILMFSVVRQNRYDLNFENTDKSGIRALAKSWESRMHQKKTIYILSPDYLAPTFGYYFSKSSVAFHGFARWERPEIFSPQNYAEIWSNPTLLKDTERLIQIELQEGYQQLALITESRALSDVGKMKYSRANQLLDTLEKKYRLIEKTDYLGLNESVSLYLFDINHSDL